jgi:hypothetical protein
LSQPPLGILQLLDEGDGLLPFQGRSSGRSIANDRRNDPRHGY